MPDRFADLFARARHALNSPMLGQVIRFGISGVGLTVFVAVGYWAIAEFADVDPNVALLIAFAFAVVLGYFVHSRWSFKGHGSREKPHLRTIRFFITTGLGFLSNQFFVWFFVKHLAGPTWWAIPPIVLVTPILTFTLNRRWVFA